MTKTQKVWLGVFLAMFIVPEVLWSPVENIAYDFLQNSNNVKIFRPNFLTSPDNITILLLFLAFQLVGLISSLILISKSQLNFWFKSLCIIVLILLLIITGAVFYFAFSLRHGISF